MVDCPTFARAGVLAGGRAGVEASELGEHVGAAQYLPFRIAARLAAVARLDERGGRGESQSRQDGEEEDGQAHHSASFAAQAAA